MERGVWGGRKEFLLFVCLSVCLFVCLFVCSHTFFWMTKFKKDFLTSFFSYWKSKKVIFNLFLKICMEGMSSERSEALIPYTSFNMLRSNVLKRVSDYQGKQTPAPLLLLFVCLCVRVLFFGWQNFDILKKSEKVIYKIMLGMSSAAHPFHTP